MNLGKSLKTSFFVFITAVLPKRMWYKVAYAMSGLLAYKRKRKKYNYKNTIKISQADKLNGLLALITRFGKPFPIPVRATGLELFQKPRPRGLILCSTHIPLTKVALRHLMDQDVKLNLAIAANPGAMNAIAVWGSTEQIPAARTGPFVLQKAKTVLQQGGTVVVLVDQILGGPYSPNVFRLAEKMDVDIIFFDAVLQPDGTVEVNYRESTWNGYAHVNRVQEQMQELYQYTAALFKRYGNAAYFSAPC